MKTTNYLHKTATATLALSLLLQASLSWAEDTEIYFGQVASDIKANVFFILDDSGSMNWCLNKQNGRGCPSNTRMDVLKKTMKNLINDTSGVNIGLMTLSRRQSLEVKDIDAGPQRTTALARINAMYARDNTPIAKALYDAARYFNGFPNKHNSSDAIGVTVESPIINECQPSHFVLLTDGQANGYSDEIRKNIQNLIGGGLVCPNENKDSGGEACSIELVNWLHTKDQSPLPDNIQKQTINTHTIGFALEADAANKDAIKQFLNDLAAKGGGNAYTADNAAELGKAFSDIIRQATDIKNTSFVNPSPADSGNSEHKKQTYYPMFKPAPHDPWPGNLKRYNLKLQGEKLVEIDRDGKPAKDANNQFNADISDVWSTTNNDGFDVSKGGAANKLSANPNTRNLWIGFNDFTMKEFPKEPIDTNANTPPSNAILGVTNAEERKALLRYIRGFKDAGATNADPRYTLGDPMHSAPTLFSYECQGDFKNGQCLKDKEENTTQMAIIGTNEGFVQMFETQQGVEQFAFMPEELLKNIKNNYEDSKLDNKSSSPHRYGMDNTVTVWVNDKNKNGKIDGDDKVYAYATMRRGGSSIYALDITDKKKPKLVWKISPDDGDFKRLGYTWSVPVKAKIKYNGEDTDILIFGAGYNNDQDKQENYRADAGDKQGGNDIYIVNAETGKLIWSASASGFAMKYSIPATVSVIKLDAKGNERADGLATQFFVGDVGGQIWRFIIDNDTADTFSISGGGKEHNGILANLGGSAGHGENSRRFYHSPDIVPDTINGEKLLFVNIGSGYRAHPLDTRVRDRMYSLRVPLVDDGITLAEDSLSEISKGQFNAAKTTEDIDVKGKRGWYIELQDVGEKIISTPKTINRAVHFNTYTPSKPGSNPCAIGLGINRTYNVDILNGAPDQGTGSYDDYVIISKSQGINGDPNVICFEGKCWVQFGPGEFSDPFSTQAKIGRKTYWIDLQQQ